MVELHRWGELQEILKEFPNDYLKELCYILGLRRSGSKQVLIDEIKNSEYTYQNVIDQHNFLDFGLYVLLTHFSSSDLTNLTRKFGLPSVRSKWVKMIEIIRSENITPRMLLGQLSTDDLESLY